MILIKYSATCNQGCGKRHERAITDPAVAFCTDCTGGTSALTSDVADADLRWDSDCLMSYTRGETLCFCGKCILRNRGWKVQGLGYPGKTVHET